MSPTTEPTPQLDGDLPPAPPQRADDAADIDPAAEGASREREDLATHVEPDGSADDETWLQGGPPKGLRVRVPVALLVLALVALGGIWGGARLQKSQGTTTPTAALASGGFGAGFGAAGQGGTGSRGQGATGANGAAPGAGGFGGGRGGTFGTVDSVDGDKIVIKNAQGESVTITAGDSTTVTKSESGAVSDIKTGDTIVVRGTTGSDGTTAAQSITIGGAGGGFPGGGIPGGGQGSGGQAGAQGSGGQGSGGQGSGGQGSGGQGSGGQAGQAPAPPG